MNIPEADMDLIDAYLAGKLTPTEQEAFELRISEDADFKKKLEDVRLVRKLVFALERKKLWGKFSEAEKRSNQNPVNNHRFLFHSPTLWAVAASLLVITMVGIYWWNQTPGEQQTFQTYYTPYRELNFPVSRGSAENEQQLIQAVAYYHEGKYADAINVLEQTELQDDRHLFVLGISYLATNDFENSVKWLERVSDEYEDHETLLWYKALAYLGYGNRNQAIELLQQLNTNRFPVNKLLQEIQ